MKYKDDSGAALTIVIISAAVMLGMAAVAVDMGYLFMTRNQLQNAADAGALAGASELVYLHGGATGSEEGAVAKAVEYATKHLAADRMVEGTDVDVDISTDASTFGVANYTGPAIRVTVRRTEDTELVTLFLGRVLGKSSAGVAATAVARLVPLQGTCGFRPWAIRDWPFGEMDIGDQATLKYTTSGSHESPGWFSPVRFPPLTRPECGNPQGGANEYRNLIVSGSSCDCIFGIGDIFRVETGNMIGPTIQGIQDLIAMDPGATYADGTVTGSKYGDDWERSERIVKVLFFPNDAEFTSSTREVQIASMGSFFILDVTGGGREAVVTGYFVGITTAGGVPGDPGTPSFILTTQLIR